MKGTVRVANETGSSSSGHDRLLDDPGPVGARDPDGVRLHEVPHRALVRVTGRRQGVARRTRSVRRNGSGAHGSERTLRHLDDRCAEDHAQYLTPFGKGFTFTRDENRYGTFANAASVTVGGTTLSLNARSGLSSGSWSTGGSARSRRARVVRDRRVSTDCIQDLRWGMTRRALLACAVFLAVGAAGGAVSIGSSTAAPGRQDWWPACVSRLRSLRDRSPRAHRASPSRWGRSSSETSGAESIRIERVELLGVDAGLELIGVLVVEPDGRHPFVGGGRGFPPPGSGGIRHRRTWLRACCRPVRRRTVVQILFGLRLTRTGPRRSPAHRRRLSRRRRPLPRVLRPLDVALHSPLPEGLHRPRAGSDRKTGTATSESPPRFRRRGWGRELEEDACRELGRAAGSTRSTARWRSTSTFAAMTAAASRSKPHRQRVSKRQASTSAASSTRRSSNCAAVMTFPLSRGPFRRLDPRTPCAAGSAMDCTPYFPRRTRSA